MGLCVGRKETMLHLFRQNRKSLNGCNRWWHTIPAIPMVGLSNFENEKETDMNTYRVATPYNKDEVQAFVKADEFSVDSEGTLHLDRNTEGEVAAFAEWSSVQKVDEQ